VKAATQAELMQTSMIVRYRERGRVGWGDLVDVEMTVAQARDAKEAERRLTIARCGTERPREGLFYFRTFPGERWIVGAVGTPIQIALCGIAVERA